MSFKTHYAACYYNKKHSDIRLVLGQHLKSVKAKMSQNLSTSKTKSIYIMSKSTYIICNNVTLLNYAHIKQQWCPKETIHIDLVLLKYSGNYQNQLTEETALLKHVYYYQQTKNLNISIL